MRAITPFLWFNDNAEEAANFYLSVFKDGKIGKVARYGEAGPGPAGSVMTIEFELRGQRFLGLNGGPHFKFTEAVSFVVSCDSQQEIDDYWEKLSAGGAKSQCGWLKDRFGLSWQVVPRILGELATAKDAKKSQSMMKAMMTMTKLDIAQLKKAFAEG
jgi:predicted 3-demethylubiquinone-9 3-methyltransferase (glyoxalase superfamily)